MLGHLAARSEQYERAEATWKRVYIDAGALGRSGWSTRRGWSSGAAGPGSCGSAWARLELAVFAA